MKRIYSRQEISNFILLLDAFRQRAKEIEVPADVLKTYRATWVSFQVEDQQLTATVEDK